MKFAADGSVLWEREWGVAGKSSALYVHSWVEEREGRENLPRHDRRDCHHARWSARRPGSRRERAGRQRNVRGGLGRFPDTRPVVNGVDEPLLIFPATQHLEEQLL